MKIPNLTYNQRNLKSPEGFELLYLPDLFSRSELPKDHNPFKHHRLGFYAILIITDGEVNHVVDFGVKTLKKDNCLIISKGQIHAFDQDSKYEGFLVLFTEEFIQKYMAQSTIFLINSLYNYFIGQNVFYTPKHNALFINILQEKINKPLINSQANFFGAVLSVYLLELAELKQEQKVSLSPNRNAEYFYNFRTLVEEKFAVTHDAKIFADMLSISYKHLNDICKSAVNRTAKSFIDDFVILEAKRLLVSTNLSSKEIAYELGFDEPTNFLKYFKRHTNYTPLEFRKILL